MAAGDLLRGRRPRGAERRTLARALKSSQPCRALCNVIADFYMTACGLRATYLGRATASG